jgi:pimeloyl-ACP methyl ester carboxylesterase
MRIKVPVLIMHSDDDQIVPIADSALLAIKLVRNGTLKVYEGRPHGMCTTHPEMSIRIFLPSFKADQSTKLSLSPSEW